MRNLTSDPNANVIGTPGGSVGLLDQEFHGRATIGQMGEIRTARVLSVLCQGNGPTVLHDLRIPLHGVSANIDHIVVSGKRVTIIDSKSWQPGWIWTFAGVTRRGLKRFPPGDKQTLAMARNAVSALLLRSGLDYEMGRSLVVVWSSNDSKRMKLRLFSPIGATAITSHRFSLGMKRLLGTSAADPRIVTALTRLLITSGRAPITDDDPFA
ncbi:MAG: nuclease-related domain-containing protein [Acidimicrobiales bacterium]